MPRLFDDRNWNAIIQATQQFANMQVAIEKTAQLMNSSVAQRQIDLVNSPAFQQQISLMNTINPILQQYVNRQQISLMNTIGPVLGL